MHLIPCQMSPLGQRIIDDMSLRNMGTRKLWACLCPRKPIRQQSSAARSLIVVALRHRQKHSDSQHNYRGSSRLTVIAATP